MSTSTVGIFIPAYQAADFVGRAVESVLAQRFGDFRLVVVDDASTDGTAEAVQPYLRDPRVDLVRNPANLGMSPNWNRGLALFDEATFVAKLDADDAYEPNFLATTVPMLTADADLGLVFGALRWTVEDSGETTVIRPFTEEWALPGPAVRALLVRRFVAYGPTILARRACYRRLGGFLDAMRIHSDWEMVVRIASHFAVAYTPKVLATAHRRAENETNQARHTTAVPDDLDLWLDLLDRGELPYELPEDERRELERAMVSTLRPFLAAGLQRSPATAAACLRLLARLRVAPAPERWRYHLAGRLAAHHPALARLTMRGHRWSERLWAHRLTSVDLPARDPLEALGRTG